MLSQVQQDFLRQIVRRELVKAVNPAAKAWINNLVSATTQTNSEMTIDLQGFGVFVTYKTGADLRGCLGCFASDLSLPDTVAKYAKLSAVADSRFFHHPLTANDLPDVVFDISVISPLQECSDPLKIRLGIDGIYIIQGQRSGCFLPQVATETGWSIEEFWSYCASHKAGLAPDAWRHGGCQCYTFTTEIIEGKIVPDKN